MSGITHTVEKVADIFGMPSVILRITNGDWTHTILCELRESVNSRYRYITVRDNVTRSLEFHKVHSALVSYWQIARKNSEWNRGFCVTMAEEILPYLYENHETLVTEIADALYDRDTKWSEVIESFWGDDSWSRANGQ